MNMKAIALLMIAALCGAAWARSGNSYTTPDGTTHYSGNFFDEK